MPTRMGMLRSETPYTRQTRGISQKWLDRCGPAFHENWVVQPQRHSKRWLRPSRTKRIKNATKRAKSAIASESAKPKMA